MAVMQTQEVASDIEEFKIVGKLHKIPLPRLLDYIRSLELTGISLFDKVAYLLEVTSRSNHPCSIEVISRLKAFALIADLTFSRTSLLRYRIIKFERDEYLLQQYKRTEYMAWENYLKVIGILPRYGLSEVMKVINKIERKIENEPKSTVMEP